MAATQPPLTLIVAATVKNGIGKNGGLPWPMLKNEMAYFARVTKRVPQTTSHDQESTSPTSHARNVVIMGRKTWESIPPKFRPLKDRTNMIISSQSSDAFGPPREDVLVAPSIEAGLQDLVGSSGRQGSAARPVGKVFVIGGSSIYDAALRLPNARHVLLTRMFTEYACDTFFPVDLESEEARNEGWRRRSGEELQEFTGETVDDGKVEETAKGEVVQYQFTLYERA